MNHSGNGLDGWREGGVAVLDARGWLLELDSPEGEFLLFNRAPKIVPLLDA